MALAATPASVCAFVAGWRRSGSKTSAVLIWSFLLPSGRSGMASIYDPERWRFRPDDLADDTLDDQWVVGIAVNGLRHLAVHAISNFLDGRYIAFHRLCDQRIDDTAEFRDVVGVDLIEGGDGCCWMMRGRRGSRAWRAGFLLGMTCWLHAKCLRYLASRC